MTVPIRVISLRRSSDRRGVMAEHLTSLGLAYDFFDAVDGYLMTAAQLAAMQIGKNPRYGTPMKPGEIGLGASYRALCLDIAAGPAAHVCILEDDAVLQRESLALLDEGFLISLPRFDILRFGHGGMMRPGFCVHVRQCDSYRLVAPVFPRGMTTAQIVSRAGAARIAAGLVPYHAAFDTHVFNDGYVRGLRTLHTEPPLAFHRGASPSTVSTPAEANWPTVGFAGRFTTKWARLAAVGRNIANYVEAWGWGALFRGLLKRQAPRAGRGAFI